LLDDYLSANPIPGDVLIPVPLHVERERERGYNQSTLLARELAARRGLALWYNGIRRIRSTRPQIDLDTSARFENVRQAFAVTTEVAGARILLIDDVCTTGATLDACAVALKERGAKSVWGLTLARGR
jgi:ComF family protein